MFQILQSNHGRLALERFAQLCADSGVGRYSFFRLVQFSPVIAYERKVSLRASRSRIVRLHEQVHKRLYTFSAQISYPAVTTFVIFLEFHTNQSTKLPRLCGKL